jgi:hypothetical protein
MAKEEGNVKSGEDSVRASWIGRKLKTTSYQLIDVILQLKIFLKRRPSVSDVRVVLVIEFSMHLLDHDSRRQSVPPGQRWVRSFFLGSEPLVRAA